MLSLGFNCELIRSPIFPCFKLPVTIDLTYSSRSFLNPYSILTPLSAFSIFYSRTISRTISKSFIISVFVTSDKYYSDYGTIFINEITLTAPLKPTAPTITQSSKNHTTTTLSDNTTT